MAPLARLDLDLIARSPSKDVPHQVNAMIQRYEAQGIQLPDVVLNQIARLCLRKGHPNEAISFCELAAQRSGNRPGYNVYNFCVLLSAYVRLLHIGGLQALVARLVESDFCTELLSLEQLQDAQRWLDARRTGRSGETAVDRAAELVSLALRHVLAKREELAAERAEVQRQVLEMVEDHGRRRRAEVESDGADTGIADQSSPGVAVL